MQKGSAAPRHDEEPLPRHGGGPPPPRGAPPVSNARIAIVMLLAAEVMFFTGLIGAYVVLRGSVAGPWPPPDQPRLPLAVTSVNSAILFLSAWTMRRAVVALERTLPRSLRWALVETALLGATFLVIQGSEWARLVWHGLTASSSIYGATFYTLIGTHGLHVAAAVVWLTVVALRFHGDRFSLKRTSGVEALSLYWYFVCALWAVLFPLVYLW